MAGKGLLFPGQGSQFVGMGRDLYEQSDRVRALFDRAQAMIDYPLLKVMFEGPEERLRETQYTQPAIFLHSIAVYEVERTSGKLKEEEVLGCAGHSLGEFTALVAAGVLSFEDGFRLVVARAQAMQRACERVPSGMTAVIGLDEHVVETICAEVQGALGEVLVPANYNAPDQLVISGTIRALEEAERRLQAQGARRLVRLNVHGAFHSPLMEPAKEELARAIRDVSFYPPKYPVYQNVTGRGVRDPEQLRQNLIEQIVSPVRWRHTIEQMQADGVDAFIELGPGRVLTGLVRRILRKRG